MVLRILAVMMNFVELAIELGSWLSAVDSASRSIVFSMIWAYIIGHSVTICLIILDPFSGLYILWPLERPKLYYNS